MPDTPISLFISYAHADSAFVDRLEADLQKQGFDPWVDRERLKGGQRWRRELQDAVKRAQVLLLNLPEQVLCKEDCKGLCPECGTNLNLKDCDCGDKDIDPRWAALKNLN